MIMRIKYIYIKFNFFISSIFLFLTYLFAINAQTISNKYEINAIDYGHSDILDPEFSNAMHNTRITVGHPNRSSIHLENYHDLLSIFEGKDEKTVWNKFGDPHPNAYANSLMSENIFLYLNR